MAAVSGEKAVTDEELNYIYNKIPKGYDRANAYISFFQDVKLRTSLAKKVTVSYKPETVLDAACGKGELSFILGKLSSTHIIMTDYSKNMLKNTIVEYDKVLSSFDNLPFKDNSFNAVMSTFAMHAADDIEAVMKEFARVSDNVVAVIAMGKSDNKFYRFISGVYLKYFQPYIALLGGEKPKDYKFIYYIYKRIPLNSEIKKIAEKYLELDFFEEHSFGSVYVFMGRKLVHQ
ncbi:MAG: class I SAM-dependent methyltransferase [Ferroplasma sp.]